MRFKETAEKITYITLKLLKKFLHIMKCSKTYFV